MCSSELQITILIYLPVKTPPFLTEKFPQIYRIYFERKTVLFV